MSARRPLAEIDTLSSAPADQFDFNAASMAPTRITPLCDAPVAREKSVRNAAKRPPKKSARAARRVASDSARPLLVIDGDSFAHRSYHALPKTILRRGRNGVSLEESCRRLIEAAKEAGGPDNITAVLVRKRAA